VKHSAVGDPATLEAQVPRGDACDQIDVVRNDENDGAASGLEANDLEEAIDTIAVEAGRRLVEEEKGGRVDECLGKRRPLPLAPRVGAEGAMAETG